MATTGKPAFKLNAADKQMIEYIVGKFHVSTPDSIITAEFTARCARNSIAPGPTKQVLKYAIKAHKANRDLYARVMSGKL